MVMDDKIPPHDLEAEEAVLGSILLDGRVIDKVAGFLSPEHFYRDKNQWIYEAMMTLFNRGDVIDQITVAHELQRTEKLDALGGVAYLSNLVLGVATTVHVEWYARIVWRLAGYRELSCAGRNIEAIAQEINPIFSESLSKAEALLSNLRVDYSMDDDHTLHHKEGMLAYIAMQREEKIKPWLITPWGNYNEMVRYRNGKTITIAGPSGMGKTMFAEQIAEYAAKELGKNCLYLFNELDPGDFLNRRACRLMTTADGRAPTLYDLEDGVYADTDEMADLLTDVTSWPGEITMVDCGGWSIHRICAEIRQQAARGLADFVVVDYLQLIPREGVFKREKTDARAIGQIVTLLKQTCRGLEGQPPLILISQVNRTLRDKSDCTLNTLRESGEIGEYSNVVSILFNQWDATKGACVSSCRLERGTKEDGKCLRRCVWVVTVKNTFGPKGEVLLRQIPYRFKFVEGRTDEHSYTRILL